jgi:hypothetical protein
MHLDLSVTFDNNVFSFGGDRELKLTGAPTITRIPDRNLGTVVSGDGTDVQNPIIHGRKTAGGK